MPPATLPPLTPMVNIPKDSVIQSGIEEIHRSNSNKRQRKRTYATISPDTTLERINGPDPKIVRDNSYNKNDQVPLQEFYYGTMQPKRKESEKENITFSFKVKKHVILSLILIYLPKSIDLVKFSFS